VPPDVAAIVLAAGAASRFGSPKALATLDGRPMLEHVLAAVREGGAMRTVVVLGHAADEIERRVRWSGERRVRNPDPDTLSASLRVGAAAVEALSPPPDAVLLALGDQPRTRPTVIRALVAALERSDAPVIAPRYEQGGGANPVLVRRSALELVREAEGDRGLGPVLARHPDLVTWVQVPGANPDVDTPADLAALAWADRVRANREQVDRVREVPDGADFYRPSTSLFRADPRRTGDPVLEALLTLAMPDDVWLDVGAGAGRYALPLALAVREVIAVEPSAAMREALGEDAGVAGIDNVRIVDARWPPESDDRPIADVGLIAHVGYDIEAIGPFLDALEAASRRLCVAVMMDRTPATIAEPFWPVVHGEPRVPLPARPELVELLRARGVEPEVTVAEQTRRRAASRDELERHVRRQLWVGEGTEKEHRFLELLDQLAVEEPDGWALRDQPVLEVGITTWKRP
jgi:CTP:molybdopterin cytidylyltransferase MocA/SAM-dependent methyltransferase